MAKKIIEVVKVENKELNRLKNHATKYLNAWNEKAGNVEDKADFAKYIAKHARSMGKTVV